MKIVYLNASGQMGGSERSLLDFMASLRAAEPRVALELIAGADGPLLEQARALGVAARALPYPRALARLGDAGAGGDKSRLLGTLGRASLSTPSVALYTTRLRRVLAAAAPDLIHTNGFKMHVLGAWAAPRGVPVLWHVHDYISSRPLMARLMRAHADHCAAAIANSLSVADDVRAACGAQLRVFPIHNAVDLGRFSPNGPALDLDRLAGLAPPHRPVVRIGLVATMARWKGHEVFLRALKMLAGDPPVRGYVIGGALYETERSQCDLEELRRLAGRLGLAGRVGFTGFVDDTAAAMRALDVVVHASTQPEPFGLVIAEAMACGRALVVSRGGGAAEIVTPGEDALVHEAGCVSALAGRMGELARDPALRAALGNRAALSARRRFARERLASELMPIYRLLCAEAV
ncbi:MAG TPA: glycosyltransferase family 4 protein [Candidatus Binataceae bacterium]|nr:glycosyltransferase family 4 protein [Candidatus Binataceae bacterium]